MDRKYSSSTKVYSSVKTLKDPLPYHYYVPNHYSSSNSHNNKNNNLFSNIPTFHSFASKSFYSCPFPISKLSSYKNGSNYEKRFTFNKYYVGGNNPAKTWSSEFQRIVFHKCAAVFDIRALILEQTPGLSPNILELFLKNASLPSINLVSIKKFFEHNYSSIIQVVQLHPSFIISSERMLIYLYFALASKTIQFTEMEVQIAKSSKSIGNSFIHWFSKPSEKSKYASPCIPSVRDYFFKHWDQFKFLQNNDQILKHPIFTWDQNRVREAIQALTWSSGLKTRSYQFTDNISNFIKLSGQTFSKWVSKPDKDSPSSLIAARLHILRNWNYIMQFQPENDQIKTLKNSVSATPPPPPKHPVHTLTKLDCIGYLRFLFKTQYHSFSLFFNQTKIHPLVLWRMMAGIESQYDEEILIGIRMYLAQFWHILVDNPPLRFIIKSQPESMIHHCISLIIESDPSLKVDTFGSKIGVFPKMFQKWFLKIPSEILSCEQAIDSFFYEKLLDFLIPFWKDVLSVHFPNLIESWTGEIIEIQQSNQVPSSPFKSHPLTSYFTSIPTQKLASSKFSPTHGLIQLQKLVSKYSPLSWDTSRKTISIASWNLERFSGKKIRERGDLFLSRIAEIISQYDIIALQEIQDWESMVLLERKLGNQWRIYRSENAHTTGYYFAFCYNMSTVECVVPPALLKTPAKKPFNRNPYIGVFVMNQCIFHLINCHIFYGSSHEMTQQVRDQEISNLGKLYSVIAKRYPYSHPVFMGDFNSEPDSLGFSQTPEFVHCISKHLPTLVISRRSVDNILIGKKTSSTITSSWKIVDYAFNPSERLSDHFPVATRFYVDNPNPLPEKVQSFEIHTLEF